MIYDGLLMGGSLVLSAVYSVNIFTIGVILLSESGVISGARGFAEYTQYLHRNQNFAIIGSNAENPNLSNLRYFLVENLNDFIYGGSALNVIADFGYCNIYASPDLSVIVKKTSGFYVSIDHGLTWSEFSVSCDSLQIANDQLSMLAKDWGGYKLSVNLGVAWVNTGYIPGSDSAYAIFNSENYAIWGTSSDSDHIHNIHCKTHTGELSFTTSELPVSITYYNENTLFLIAKNEPGYNGCWLYKVDLVANTLTMLRYFDVTSLSLSISNDNVFVCQNIDTTSTVYVFSNIGVLLNSFSTQLNKLSNVRNNFL